MKCIGALLSGMGRDGADGIAHIKRIKGITLVQEKESGQIYGMPKEAIATNCVDWILTPTEIQRKLIEWVGTMPGQG